MRALSPENISPKKLDVKKNGSNAVARNVSVAGFPLKIRAKRRRCFQNVNKTRFLLSC